MNFLNNSEMNSHRERKEVEPYSELAKWYNEVMDHVDYGNWADYIITLIRKHQGGLDHVVDLACGTGTLARYLFQQGVGVSGFDGNADMIHTAQLTYTNHLGIPFEVCRMTDLPPVEHCDAVLCLYDSLNYLMDESGLVKFFKNVYEILAPGGLLIFDCSTRKNSETHFQDFVDVERVSSASLSRRAWYDRKERIQNNLFEIMPDDDNFTYIEHHQQRIWEVGIFDELLAKANLKLQAKYDGTSLKKGSEASDRVHFVAQR